MEGSTQSFSRRSIQTKGEIPAARDGGLSVAIGDNIYYFGGRTTEGVDVTEVRGAFIRVFNTKSDTWSKIEVTPPKQCGNFSYGTVVGTDIWVYDSYWICFDTVKQVWKDQVVKSPDSNSYYQSLHPQSIAVIGNSMYYYDSDLNSFEKNVYRVDTETNQISSTTAQEGFGEHPQERHETFVIAIADDVLVLYAPVSIYDKKKGELFYYDLKEGKWARVNRIKNDPDLNLYAYKYGGRIGTSLYFIPERDSNPNHWWALDLATKSWVKKIVGGLETTTFARYSTIVGDKIYCWMSDGQMTVVDVTNMPSKDEQKQIDEQLANEARAALSQIKQIVAVIDEYIPESIVVNTTLDPVNLAKPTIHREMVTGMVGLFPKLDPEKIIESTVASPSDSVFMHKNYIHYLTLAWSNHFSVVISPDIIFYTVLCEIADEILTHPNDFRHLFTNSAEKKGIMSLTHDVTQIDLNSLIKGISENVPVDTSIFTADFSCSTNESRLAMQSAFCEAMSAYYFYMSTLCGIPRIKILGTKQDWETVEKKFHQMRTEVFNQDGTTGQTMSQYLQRAEEQTRKIYTTRDPEFWKEMFSIDTCSSGHTDVVEGWISQFYRNGSSYKMNGKVRYTGDDFYNYKSHISTVKWHNVETARHFELKSGLMYSNVVTGDTEIATKFPWLEPQFGHVIVETDPSGKMTPAAFKNYVDSLRDEDKELMQQFYEVLKDDPIELVKGDGEIKFRLTLLTRLVTTWKRDYSTRGLSVHKIDLEKGAIGNALEFDGEISSVNKSQLIALRKKIVDYLKADGGVTSVILNKKLSGSIEAHVLDVLIDSQSLEELSVFLPNQEAVDKLSELLLHPDCKLKTLHIGKSENLFSISDGYESEKMQKKPLDYTNLGAALIKTRAAIESFTCSIIDDENIAKGVAELCRRPNGLKRLKTESKSHVPAAIGEIILRGQLESKILQEVELVGDQLSTEMIQFIVDNLPNNPNLEKITRFELSVMTAAQIAQALRIPSLKSLSTTMALQDLSFLAVTTKLNQILAPLNCSAEQIQPLSDFMAREDCPLEAIFAEKSTFPDGACVVLAKGLAQNKSLKTLNIRNSTIKSAEEKTALVESIVLLLERPDCRVENIILSEIPDLIFEGQLLQRLLRALTTNKTVNMILLCIACTAEELPLMVDLVKKNSTLKLVQFGGKRAQFSAEERAPLVAAVQGSASLQRFVATVLADDEQKYW